MKNANSPIDTFIDDILKKWLKYWADQPGYRYGDDVYAFIGECLVSHYCHRGNPLLLEAEKIISERKNETKTRNDSSTEKNSEEGVDS